MGPKDEFPIAVSIWTFGNLSLDEIARRSASLGLDGVELLADVKTYEPTEVRRIMEDHGLRVLSI